MGGKKWDTTKGSWGYWRGSWQARSPQQGSAFPAYDSRDGRRNYWDRDQEDPEEGATFAQVLQSSLNGTRKTEQKVISINNAIAKRKEMWDNYVRDMKAAYKKEEQRFHREMERLRGDLAKAAQTQEEARATLLRVAAEAATFGSASSTGDVPMSSSGVDQIFDSWRADEDEFDDRALFQRALAANAASRTAMGPPPGLSPQGPDLGTTMAARAAQAALYRDGAPAGPLPAAAAAPSGHAVHSAPPPRPPDVDSAMGHAGYAGIAARDPYMASPGHASSRTSGPVASPSARVSPYPETSAPPGAPIDPVAARLAANRAANPFAEGSSEPTFGAIRGIDPTNRPVPTLIEDDDELAAPPDSSGIATGV